MDRVKFRVHYILFLNQQMAADAEKKDNLAEQTRQHGKRVRYGEIVQVNNQHHFYHNHHHLVVIYQSQKDTVW